MAGLIDPGHVRVVRGTGAQHGAHGQASLQLQVWSAHLTQAGWHHHACVPWRRQCGW